jgi:phosphoribosylanthranilate isomerase
MTWVKVCGITSVEARDAAVRAGADALGFVFVDGSPRKVDVRRAAALISGTPVPAFILVADVPPDAVMNLAVECGASGIQPYGEFAGSVAHVALSEGYDVLYPITVGMDGPPAAAPAELDDALVLFDTDVDGVYGGSGRTFAWSMVAEVDRPFVLAGGLGADNVAEAIRLARPFGVDASSRLESAPGVKDPDRILAFVREAKQA